MQKIIEVQGTVHEYIASPLIVLTNENRSCPFCPSRHRLRRHGGYHRTAILPGGLIRVIVVLRLLCSATGRTLSLLPDFCLPGRQHGPAVLGLFLVALIVRGLTLLEAMRAARPDAPPNHSLPQSLLRCFLGRLGGTRTWLARQTARAPNAPVSPVPSPSSDPAVSQGRARVSLEARLVVASICDLRSSAEAAFIHASRGVHDLNSFGIA